ncbi:MAG: amidohydrolase [Synergistaceae bacterium]|nr:amidohydrolase [Synergistaceae bacterium]
MYDKIVKFEEQYRPETIENYKHLHMHPEISYEERETAAFVVERLKKLPLDEVKTGVGGCGVSALLRGGLPGPVVALRADMDALSITEKTAVDYASRNPGVMHACGHDGHTAMLLSAAAVLCEMKEDLPGSVRFIFQPAEEKTPRGGAQWMIEDGVLDSPRVDAVLGMHLWPSLPTGEIAIQPGAVSAASDHLTIKVSGKASHGAIPDEGIDANLAAAAVLVALQGIVSRRVPPRESAVVSIGTMNGGTKYNIIAEEAVLDGTVRTFNPSVREMMPKWIEQAAKGAAEAYGASAAVDYVKGYPSVINAPEVAEIAHEAAAAVFGEQGLAPEMPIPPIGEDFSFYAQKRPALFAMLGCRQQGVQPEDMPALHNDKFLPDLKALSYGVRYICAAAVTTLKRLGEK